ncbi:ATP-binding cassette domain-containing protein [Pseudothermotoga sp.]
MLRLQNVTLVRDSKFILKNINLTFNEKEVHVIMGPNGAGKSSLAYVIMGLEGYKPTEGRIFLDDVDITDLRVDERAKLGIHLMWQEPVRFRGLTVRQYLTLGGKMKVSQSDLEEVLHLVGLSPSLYLNRMVDDLLSGGERKRVELASILLLRPKFAIMDEPDSGIDVLSLDMVKAVAQRIVGQGGCLVMITHREEMVSIANVAHVLCDGRIIQTGPADKIMRYYKSFCDVCDHTNVPVKE